MSLPINILHHLQFYEFIDHSSVLEFSRVSTSCHHVVRAHIEQHLTFNIPLFSLQIQPPVKFLKHYENTKRINNKLNCALHDYISEGASTMLPHILPPLTTHYTESDVFVQDPNIKQKSRVINYLPPSLKYLNVKRCVNHETNTEYPIEFTELPKSLKYLNVNLLSDHQTPSFPFLTHFDFGSWNSNLDYLPETLLVLNVGDEWNQSVDKLPSHLKKLTFGRNFDQDVDNLPSSLVYLKFSHWFNQPVNKLPHSLKKVFFGFAFNQSIDSLPPHLTHLDLGSRSFSQQINKIPPFLIFLTIFYVQSSVVNCDFPNSIIHLQMLGNCSINQLPPFISHLELENFPLSPPIMDNLALSLRKITFWQSVGMNIDYFPPCLTHIWFGNRFNKPVDHLPASLTHLIFGYDFNNPVDYLPPHLLNLEFKENFNQPIDYLPLSLLKLRISSWAFHQNVDHLPPSLKEVNFFGCFNSSVDHLPSSLKSISFENFDKPLDNLPSSVADVRFYGHFNQFIDHLPQHLKYLGLNNCAEFNKPVDNLPTTLTSLIISSNSMIQPIDNLPNSLTFLLIEINSFPPHVFDNLPYFLKHLTISGTDFDDCLDHLPPSLLSLDIPHVKETTKLGYLPTSLTQLRTSSSFSKIKNMLPNLIGFNYSTINFRRTRVPEMNI